MLRRKLQALEYHSASTFDPEAPADRRALAVWLEDQKIRHLKIEEREALREAGPEAKWREVFTGYLAKLDCPYDLASQQMATLDWLLGVALRYDYTDMAENQPDLRQGLATPTAAPGVATPTTTPTSAQQPSSSSTSGKSPLDIDPTDATFRSGVEALAKIVQVTPHPDPSVLLEAVRLVIQEKLSPQALEAAAEEEEKRAEEEEAEEGKGRGRGRGVAKRYDITPRECGFEMDDPGLAEAAKVLRLLHLRELRQLQTHVNEMIVAVQALTADPKTDQTLGQVGR